MISAVERGCRPTRSILWCWRIFGWRTTTIGSVATNRCRIGSNPSLWIVQKDSLRRRLVARWYLEDYDATIPNVSHPFVLASGGEERVIGLPRNYWVKQPSFTYMRGNPVGYSRGAMERMRRGLELGRLVKQCVEFGVTYDVRNALLNWIYSLDALWICSMYSHPGSSNMSQTLGCGGSRHWKVYWYRVSDAA